jgi:uncharacterized protein involved in outer membrane biogenesis
MSATLFPPGVELTNVSFAAGGPTFQSVSCHLRIRPLLEGRLELGKLVLHGASMTVERTAAGDLQIGGPLAGLLADSPQGGAGGAEALAGLDSLPTVTVDDATITFLDHRVRGGSRTLQLDSVKLSLAPETPGTVQFTLAAHVAPAGEIRGTGKVTEVAATEGRGSDHALDASFTATGVDADTVVSHTSALIPGGGTAQAQGVLDASLSLSGTLGGGLTGTASMSQSTGSVLWDEVSLAAPVSFTARVTTSGGTVAIADGGLQIAHLAAARIVASDIDVAFAIARGTLHFTSARASAYGGTWSMTGAVTLGEPPKFDVRLNASDVHCDALLTAVVGAHPEYGCDRFNADAALQGEWTGATTVAERAHGSGRVEMLGGTIPSSSIIGALWRSIEPVVPVHGKPTHFSPPTRVQRLTQSFTLNGGRMHTNDLTLVTDDYTVTGAGTIGLDGSLDLQTNVALSPAGVAKLLVIASVSVPRDVPNLPAVPTRITGTLSSPMISPVVTDIPLVAIRGLFGSVRGVGEALTGTAERGIKGFARELERACRRLTR